ncbi:hypothetical protein [Halobacterium hubeiense]|uniref:hypothetical protein n=1 Tax=Halobacterium hubeiense TaxID=1407499 RepID=UPI003C734FA6
MSITSQRRDLDDRGREELRADVRRLLGFEPRGSKLRVAELRRAVRRLEDEQPENPLEDL